MAQIISATTKFFIKRWNSAKSNYMREKLLKKNLSKLFLNTDLVCFLDEFTKQFEPDKRVKMLLLCRKLLIQNPPKVDEVEYKALQEEYDEAMSKDTSIDGLTWIDEELAFIKAVNEVDEIFDPLDRRKRLGEPTIPLESVIPNAAVELMKLEEVLAFFDIHKSTLDRWRKDGFPLDKVGKKLYANKAAALAWVSSKKPNKIQFAISKR